MNLIIEIAKNHRRNYITPEDVKEALEKYPNINDIRLDLLEVLGNVSNFGVEDYGSCAFIAWNWKEKRR